MPEDIRNSAFPSTMYGRAIVLLTRDGYKPEQISAFLRIALDDVKVILAVNKIERSRVDSYEPRAVRPVVGTIWVWEHESAPELIKVTAVRWNGEEWFVGTKKLGGVAIPSWRPWLADTTESWNDLSRFWEACHYVAKTAGPPSTKGILRTGPPLPGELANG
jgi:hypothetical protein